VTAPATALLATTTLTTISTKNYAPPAIPPTSYINTPASNATTANNIMPVKTALPPNQHQQPPPKSHHLWISTSIYLLSWVLLEVSSAWEEPSSAASESTNLVNQIPYKDNRLQMPDLILPNLTPLNGTRQHLKWIRQRIVQFAWTMGCLLRHSVDIHTIRNVFRCGARGVRTVLFARASPSTP